MDDMLIVSISSTHVKGFQLTHWGRVTHICVSKLTNAGLLLIGPLGTNFSEILVEIITFSFKKMHLKVSSGKWWPSCLGLNVLSHDAMYSVSTLVCHRADFRFPPSQRVTSLQSNAISHWLGANLESALCHLKNTFWCILWVQIVVFIFYHKCMIAAF